MADGAGGVGGAGGGGTGGANASSGNDSSNTHGTDGTGAGNQTNASQTSQASAANPAQSAAGQQQTASESVAHPDAHVKSDAVNAAGPTPGQLNSLTAAKVDSPAALQGALSPAAAATPDAPAAPNISPEQALSLSTVSLASVSPLDDPQSALSSVGIAAPSLDDPAALNLSQQQLTSLSTLSTAFAPQVAQATTPGLLDTPPSMWSLDATKAKPGGFADQPDGLYSPERMQNFGVPVFGDRSLSLTVSPGLQVPPNAPGALPDLLSGVATIGVVTSPPLDVKPLNLGEVNFGVFGSTNFVEAGNGESVRKQGVTIGAKIEGKERLGGRFSLSGGVTLKEGSFPKFNFNLTVPVDLSGVRTGVLP